MFIFLFTPLLLLCTAFINNASVFLIQKAFIFKLATEFSYVLLTFDLKLLFYSNLENLCNFKI